MIEEGSLSVCAKVLTISERAQMVRPYHLEGRLPYGSWPAVKSPRHVASPDSYEIVSIHLLL